jgi:hypothetical protein
VDGTGKALKTAQILPIRAAMRQVACFPNGDRMHAAPLNLPAATCGTMLKSLYHMVSIVTEPASAGHRQIGLRQPLAGCRGSAF